jgi:hypothetical protein
MNTQPLLRVMWIALIAASGLALSGCRTTPALPAVNFAEPGWSVQQGQAVWKARATAPEIAGEVLLANHSDGRSLIQFTKTPFPIVIAQSVSNRWEIQFVPEGRTFRGRGLPPKYFGWLHLLSALSARPLPKSFTLARPGAATYRLESPVTGESIEGYFSP